MNEKTSGNQALPQKSHLRNKHQGSSSYKILGTILKMNKGGTHRSEPKDKKVDEMHKALHLRNDIDRQCVKKRRRKRTHSIKQCMNVSI